MEKRLPDSKGPKTSQARPFVFAPSEALRKPYGHFRFVRANWPVFLLFLFLAILSGAYLFTVFPDWRHLTSVLFRPAEEMSETELPLSSEVATPVDLIARLPNDLRKELMSRDLQSTAQFSRNFVHPLSSLCDALSETGVGHFSISLNPVSEDRKVCTSDVIPIGDGGGDAAASSIFVWALGTDNDAVAMFRIKVNLTNLKSADATKAAALVVLKRLHTELNWDMPSSVERSLQEMKDATISYFGVVYQLTREWSSVPRLNILIRAKDVSGLLPNTGFQRFVGARAVTHQTARPKPYRAPSVGTSDTSPQQPAAPKAEPIENLYR